jgi:glycosyltransferase involved in cell wall biosynthesis
MLEINAPLIEESARYRRLDCPEEASLLERTALSGADIVFAVTQQLAEHARAHGARRAEVMPNAAAVTPARSGAITDAVRVVLAGTLRPWHGVSMIVEAWRQLGSSAPPLLVIGDGYGREALEEVGAEVTGPLPRSLVSAALTRGHIGLAPYAADAPKYFSPLKVFEYLGAGLALVASDLPGISSVVSPECAVIIPAGDADRLAETVGALAADPQRVAQMGSAGRALVADRHTWAHRARRILEAASQLREAGIGVT